MILEFPKDPSLPLYKYHIRYFSTQPEFNVNFNRKDPATLPLEIHAEKVIEVPINANVPKPYIIHNTKDFVENLEEINGK